MVCTKLLIETGTVSSALTVSNVIRSNKLTIVAETK